MKIERIEIRNFKAFRHVIIENVPKFCVLVGANGTGKSTFLEVFGFLRDAINDGVNDALASLEKGRGFDEVRSRGSEGNIEIEIKYRAEKGRKGWDPLVTYFLSIAKDEETGLAVVEREFLQRKRQGAGKPWMYLDFRKGKGKVVEGEVPNVEEKDRQRVERKLKKPDILAIGSFSQLKEFPAIASFGDMIGGWHVSDIHINKVRNEPEARGKNRHLSSDGRNLSRVIDYLYKNHKDSLEVIKEKMKQRIPGVSGVKTTTIAETSQTILKIETDSFSEPFWVQYVSDGTIKMLAYLVLLNDPAPYPLLCIEEPENQLYPQLLSRLVGEFNRYVAGPEQRQLFITTHSPELLDEVGLDEVLVLIKGKDGYTDIKPVSSYQQVRRYVEQDGEKLGRLWMEGWFEGADPS